MTQAEADILDAGDKKARIFQVYQSKKMLTNTEVIYQSLAGDAQFSLLPP